MTAAIVEQQAARRENEHLLSLQSELAEARRQNTQLQQLLEEDSEKHPSNKQAKADRSALTRVRNELAVLRSNHTDTNRELERAKDINDQSVIEYLAQTRAIQDWKNSRSVLKKQLADKTQELATLSADCEKKDKELECLRDGNYYDEFSDETHISRQNRYFRENNELCSEIEEMCKTVLKYQGDLEDRTRSCNAAENELAKQRKTLRRYESIMETQRVDLGTYKNNLGRLESKYDDVVSQLDEANSEIVEREARIENAGEQSSISELKSIVSMES